MGTNFCGIIVYEMRMRNIVLKIIFIFLNPIIFIIYILINRILLIKWIELGYKEVDKMPHDNLNLFKKVKLIS